MSAEFKLPGITDRVTVIGQTGSGKSQFSLWLLSRASFDKQPFIVIDSKLDELIGAVSRIKEIGLGDKLPKEPGLYVVRPRPGDEDAVDDWLWKVWSAERIGLYIDEGYSIPKNSKGFQAVLVQGRSKRIPLIACTQRPSQISRFLFSEAQYYAVFRLNDRRDQKIVQEFADINFDLTMEPYHSAWYDVKQSATFSLEPVPDADELVDIIDERLKPNRRFF